MKVSTEACILGSWVPVNDTRKILDIGAGTGLISLMLAQRSEALIDAVEIDESAFMQCCENFQHSPWFHRLQVIHGPIQDLRSSQKYDLIISNPPFFTDHYLSLAYSKNRAKHTGELSFKDLWESVDRFLSNRGSFYILLPENESGIFEEEGKNRGYNRKNRLIIRNKKEGKVFRMITGYSKSEKGYEEDEMNIRDSSGNYSEKFLQFLSPYYLYL